MRHGGARDGRLLTRDAMGAPCSPSNAAAIFYFSRDGRFIATASADGTAWVGPFDPVRGLRPDPVAVRARIDALTTAVIMDGHACTPLGARTGGGG